MFLDIFVLMYFESNKCSLGEHKILLNDGLLQWTLMSQQFLLQSIAMFCYSNAMHGIIWDFCVCEFLPCVVLGSLAVLVQCPLCFSWYRGFQLLMLCVCVCVCVCVCMFMWFMRTQICIMTSVWHRYYKEKVIYEDSFSVPIIQNAYKSYRVRFFWGKVEMHHLLWGLSLGVG